MRTQVTELLGIQYPIIQGGMQWVGTAGARGKVALEDGDVDGGVVSAGMVIGFIDDVPTCAELIQRIVADCRKHLRAAVAMAAA